MTDTSDILATATALQNAQQLNACECGDRQNRYVKDQSIALIVFVDRLNKQALNYQELRCLLCEVRHALF
jgi:hypothetical protein